MIMHTALITLWLLLGLSAKTQQLVEVGGELEESTTWTNAFTYVVIDDLIVPEGIELVIMPGVKVQFYANRGLFVEQGSLKVLGDYEGIIDTVRFELLEGQLWKGISLNMVQGEGVNVIDHALIEGGEIGIRLEESSGVRVTNSSVLGGVTNILIHNSSNNFIYNNHFGDNGNVALDVAATGIGNKSAENRIEENLFSSSRYTNLRVRFENQGACPGNRILNNYFSGADVGMFIGNSDLVNNDSILIKGNVFYNIGTESFGYSISSGMDNTHIMNNIFWQNTLGIELRRGSQFGIIRNSFYQNTDAIALRRNAVAVSLSQNSFSGQVRHLINFNEATDLFAEGNNILNNELSDGIVRNQTSDDIDFTQAYWGTTDSLTIAAMVYDFYDDENLGKLHFDPYLEWADTTAPVSPPHRVYKQLQNGQTRLSWHKNPEMDVRGYAVYQGSLLHYRFDEPPLVLSDTVLLLPGDQTGVQYAVTAFDLGGYGLMAQQEGAESAFAIAIAMPFAGADTAICSNVPVFEILHSTVPFAYQELFWATNGDGVFSNEAMLRPTYTPGPLDTENGSVRLSLNVVSDGISYQDSFKLTLSNIPEVFAGYDLIMPLADSVVLAEAQALHFEQLEWASHGDGIFDNPNQLHPVYYFGQQDIISGKVRLVLSASSACGQVSDTMTIYVRGQYAVEGKVLNQESGVAGAAVIAFTDLADERMQTAGLVRSQTDGSYRFDTLYAADYLFYAVADTSESQASLPAFYVDKLHWQQAYRLPLQTNTYQVELELQQPAVELPPGSGRISGRFELPDELNGLKHYCLPWFADHHNDYCDGGLSNVSILLYNDTYEIPMAASLTDENGRFFFEQLPFGHYYITAEIPGYETAPSSLISLTPDEPSQHEISLYIMEKFKIGVDVPFPQLKGTKHPFPNPGREYIHLVPETLADEPITIVLYNQQGQQMKQWSFPPLSYGRLLSLYVGDMGAGSYLLQMRMGSEQKTYPLLLNR